MRTSSRPFFLLLILAALYGGVASLLLSFCVSSVRAQNTDDDFTGHVVAVTAGDTMDVRVGGEWTVTVRLHGVECPTTPRALRETATRYTSRLVLDTDVRVEVRGTASRSVVYGEVFPATGGESVNFKLARDGVATWASAYAAGRNDLADAEAYARTARRGLWGANDGSNIALPASVADAIKKKAAAAAAEVAAAKAARERAEVAAAAKAAEAARVRAERERTEAARKIRPSPTVTPTSVPPVADRDPVKPSPVSALPSVPAKSVPTNASLPAPLIGGVSVAVLTLLSLLAYAVAHGLPFAPRRLVAQIFLALVAGGLGAMAFLFPVAGWQRAFQDGAVPTFLIVALVAPLLSVLLLRAGSGVLWSGSRLRGAAADPRHAGPGPVKLHGTARSASGDLVRSNLGRIKGLYVREVTQWFTAETAGGKRSGTPRWVGVGDTADAVDFELFSSAGDGTGAALVLAAQDGEAPQSVAPAAWIPYHVARFYNEIPSDNWFATAYEGDTRTEIFFVPNGATLTVWGALYAPAPESAGSTASPVPRVASDSAIGSLLICDGPEARAYAGRGGASLALGIGCAVLGLVCAAGALWGLGGGGTVARQSATASLGIGLAVLLALAIGRGIMLARNAVREEREGESDPLRRPSSAVWDRYRTRFPGAVIAPVVGD